MAAFRTLDSLQPKGKRVLVRVDLNVPMENGKVTDATRIDRILPTIREIADKGGKVILLAHFGRPKNGPDEANSLKPIAAVLADHLKRPVAFAADCIGEVAEKAVAAMKDGDVLLLENTRFHKGEEKNDPAIVAGLAALGDAYVNDAFSAAHRAHASTEGVAHKLPAYAGRTMQAELEALDAALALGRGKRRLPRRFALRVYLKDAIEPVFQECRERQACAYDKQKNHWRREDFRKQRIKRDGKNGNCRDKRHALHCNDEQLPCIENAASRHRDDRPDVENQHNDRIQPRKPRNLREHPHDHNRHHREACGAATHEHELQFEPLRPTAFANLAHGLNTEHHKQDQQPNDINWKSQSIAATRLFKVARRGGNEQLSEAKR